MHEVVFRQVDIEKYCKSVMERLLYSPVVSHDVGGSHDQFMKKHGVVCVCVCGQRRLNL